MSFRVYVVALLLVVSVASAKKPHLFFALIDDMGYNDFYTSSDISAAWKHVAQMAPKDCVRIEHYYSQPICTPTRAAFMSGRNPVRLGLQHKVIAAAQAYGLPLDEVTLPDKLRAAGYNTVGVGKWHLGLYNNASLPTRRGFNHWYGFWQGGETHSTHKFPPSEALGTLDLNNDEVIDRGKTGVYSAELFSAEAERLIADHKSQNSQQPLFLYLAMQNVHDPLEAPAKYTSSPACEGIVNPDRKTFCGMAMAVDETIGNVTNALRRAFPDEDVVMVISGDNGGFPGAAGNNCNENGLCLRGFKGTNWEGGVRNNALVCSQTLLPVGRRGQVFSKGLVHVTDWHATFQELAGVPSGNSWGKPLDGMNVWGALTQDKPSPRTEFLVNVDPVTPMTNVPGLNAAYRFQGCVGSPPACGDWKLLSGENYNASWYHLPTTTANVPTPGVQGGPSGEVVFTQASGPGGFPIPPIFPNSTQLLYNISADPEERSDMAAQYPQVVAALQAKIDFHASQALAPCNVPGGTCFKQDLRGLAKALVTRAWVPWVPDATVV